MPADDPDKKSSFGAIKNLGETKDQLHDLGKRLDAARGTKNGKKGPGAADGTPDKGNPNAASRAFRLGTELVVGVLVGGFIGWWIDRFFETQPIFLVVFLLLGFAAGLKNVWLAAQKMQAENPPTGQKLPDNDDDDA